MEKKYSQKEMENAVMLAGGLYQRLYNESSIKGGTLDVVMAIIHEAVKMERWITEKYGPDDEDYLDRVEEYEAIVLKEYGLEEKSKNDGYFVITRLHREDLEAAGFDASDVDDATMERIADKMGDDYVTQLFWEHLPVFAEDMGIPKR